MIMSQNTVFQEFIFKTFVVYLSQWDGVHPNRL